MVGAEMSGDGAGMWGLVEALLLEADRIGTHRRVAAHPHHRRDSRRVDATGEKRSERHVGHEPTPYRVPKQHFQRIGRLAVAHMKLCSLSALSRLLHTPEGGRGDLPFGIDGRDVARLELADAPIDRMRRRHVSEPQIGSECIAVELRPPAGQHLEGLELRGKHHTPVLRSIVERLDAYAVANKTQRAVSAIPYRESEHADEALDRGAHAPFGDGLDQDLGIGMPTEAPPARLELWPQVSRIVDFAVVADDAGAAARHHGLRARRREIDDCERSEEHTS